ncbi:MAG: helix-turn-helix transcriptional regulator [Clostridia bacterium]|nr:helix-turn-helix transcriptional regulator [Clostridia bacterium]
MSQNKRESITSFVDERLKIHVNTSWVINNDYIYEMPYKDYYQIYYLRTGNFICYQDNKRFSVDEGSIIIKPFNKELRFKSNVKSNGKYIKSEIIIISVHPSLFKEQKGDDNFYRLFDTKDKNIYTKKELKSFDFENIIFKNIDKYIAYKLGLVNFQGLISVLITELNFIFDELNRLEYSSNSDEYKVKVYDYISKNFTSNITLDSVAKKFNVTPFYVEKVTKKFYSHSFYKTILNLRMWHARTLMSSNDSYNLSEIAKLCGYIDYSGFYKAYVKFFKVSPKKDLGYYKKHKQFLSSYM